MIKGLFDFSSKLTTDVKVVNEAVFSTTSGYKNWKFLGITYYSKNYDESVDKVEFLDKDSKDDTPAMGFGKTKTKK